MGTLAKVWSEYLVVTGDPLAKAVLGALAENANDSGTCWPSQATVAFRTELSVRTVKRKVAFLSDHGIISITRRWQGKNKTVNLYTLQISKSFDIPKNIIREITIGPGDTPSPALYRALRAPMIEGIRAATEAEGDRESPSNSDIEKNPPFSISMGTEGPLQDSKGTPEAPLKGTPVAPKSQGNQITTTNYDLVEVPSPIIPAMSKVAIDINWQPNTYVAERLQMLKAIPLEFSRERIQLFALNYNGQTRRQSAWEKAFSSWVIKDWELTGHDWKNEKLAEPISTDWQPSDETIDALVQMGMDPLDHSFQILVMEFRIYWRDRGAARVSFNTYFLKFCRWHLADKKNTADQDPGFDNLAGTVRERLNQLSSRDWAE